MTNNTNGISTEIRVNGEKLVCVNSFKYPGAIITDEGSKPEILAMVDQTTAALTKLKTIWNDRKIACQDNPAGHSIRKEKERQTEKEMGRQHPGMDWHDAGRRHEEG